MKEREKEREKTSFEYFRDIDESIEWEKKPSQTALIEKGFYALDTHSIFGSLDDVTFFNDLGGVNEIRVNVWSTDRLRIH